MPGLWCVLENPSAPLGAVPVVRREQSKEGTLMGEREPNAEDARIDPSGQPAGDPIEMAKANGFCPIISSTTALMIPQPSLSPNQQQKVAPAVMPMFAPCIGDRCGGWFRGMCPMKSIAMDLRALGNHIDAAKFKGL